MKQLMTGNEAIARGAWEAGVHVVAAYPGTPSTEITENAAKYEEIYAEWAPNEKVAMEVGIGAAIGECRHGPIDDRCFQRHKRRLGIGVRR